MELEYTKDDGVSKAGAFNEKEAVCNWAAPNPVFGKSVGVLKNVENAERGNGNFHAFVAGFPENCLRFYIRNAIIFFVMPFRKMGRT